MYYDFLSSGYLSVKNKKIYEIDIDSSCSNDYKSGNYLINQKLRHLDTLAPPFLCDIHFNEFCSTVVNVGDTITHIVKEFDWVILKTKFFDKMLQDTVYIFEKKGNGRKSVGFSFTYKHGFVGLFAVFHKIDNVVEINNPVIAIRNAYGRIYEDSLKRYYPEAEIMYLDSIKTEFIDIDLSLIKEFTKNE